MEYSFWGNLVSFACKADGECIFEILMKKLYSASMKKVAAVCLLLFVVPQITLASWWNPTTWFNNWRFRDMKEDKTQVLEDRIKDLEETVKKSTPGTTTKVIAEVRKTTQKTSESAQNENMAPLAINSLNNQLNYLDEQIQDFLLISDHSQKMLDYIHKTRELDQKIISLGHLEYYFVDLVNDFFDQNVTFFKKDKKNLDDYIQQLKNYREDTENQIHKLTDGYVSKNDWAAFSSSLLKIQNGVNNAYKTLTDSHFDLVNGFFKEQDKLDAALKDGVQIQLDSRSTYRPTNCIFTPVGAPGYSQTWLSSCF